MAAFLTLLDRPTLYNEIIKVKTQLKKQKKTTKKQQHNNTNIMECLLVRQKGLSYL